MSILTNLIHVYRKAVIDDDETPMKYTASLDLCTCIDP